MRSLIGNATWAHDQFSATVRTAIIHLLSAVHTKGALKTTNHSLTRFRQTNGTLLAHIAHLQHSFILPETTWSQ
jgi:hypothetical protein